MPPRLSRPAGRDLDDIYYFGLERWGEAQADAYAAEFWQTALFAAEHPLAFRLRDEVDPPVRIQQFGSHLIIYEVDERGIFILRVLHAHSDWPKLTR